MQPKTRNLLVLLGVLGIGCLLSLPVLYRIHIINKATQTTTQFCNSVNIGDNLSETLERARSGAWFLAAAINGIPPTPGTNTDIIYPKSVDALKVIFETREGKATWPRYLIWTGPLYQRVYCGLEPSKQGTVQAIHLGPIDEETAGFFEDWFDD